MTFLTDYEWHEELANGRLIREGSWNAENVRHASYMLRLASEVHVARKGLYSQSRHRLYQIEHLTDDEPLRLNPGDAAYLYSVEELDIPSDCLGLTVARGLLFAESLAPENTYVDPGFRGRLYTVVTNVSEGVVTLTSGMNICRLFVARLSGDVENPYESGDALGIPQKVDSDLAVQEPSVEELRTFSNSELIQWSQDTHSIAAPVVELHRRTLIAQRRGFLVLVAWPLLLLIANWEPVRDVAGPFASNVIAGLVAAALWFGGTKILGRVGA